MPEYFGSLSETLITSAEATRQMLAQLDGQLPAPPWVPSNAPMSFVTWTDFIEFCIGLLPEGSSVQQWLPHRIQLWRSYCQKVIDAHVSSQLLITILIKPLANAPSFNSEQQMLIRLAQAKQAFPFSFEFAEMSAADRRVAYICGVVHQLYGAVSIAQAYRQLADEPPDPDTQIQEYNAEFHRTDPVAGHDILAAIYPIRIGTIAKRRHVYLINVS